MPFKALSKLPSPERRMTNAEVAEFLGVTEGRVRGLAANGRFPSRKSKGVRLYDLNDIIDYRNNPKPVGRPKGSVTNPHAKSEAKRAARIKQDKARLARPGGHDDRVRAERQRQVEIDAQIYQVPKADFCICEHAISRHADFGRPGLKPGRCDTPKCGCTVYKDSVLDAVERVASGLPPRMTNKAYGRLWRAKEKAQDDARYTAADDRTKAILLAQAPACECGHVEDEHSSTGECQVEGCLCGGYDEADDA